MYVLCKQHAFKQFVSIVGVLFVGAISCICAAEELAKDSIRDYHAVRGRKSKPMLQGRFEGEHLPMEGSSRPQAMRAFGNQWSGNAHSLWAGKEGQSFDTSFDIAEAGRFNIDFQLTMAPDYGVFDLYLNEKLVADNVQLYDPAVRLASVVKLQNVQLDIGEQRLRFVCVGKHEKAKFFGRDRDKLF